MEVHPAALPLHLVDLAFAVVLATSLKGEQFRILGEPLQRSQQVTYGHIPRVATVARLRGCASRWSWAAAGAALPAVTGPRAADQAATDDPRRPRLVRERAARAGGAAGAAD